LGGPRNEVRPPGQDLHASPGIVPLAWYPDLSLRVTETRMAQRHDSMINPPIEELLDRTDSKFRLVTLSAKRARQINSYFGQLGEGIGSSIPPQVTSTARKPLSIAFEEIAADKIIGVEPAPVLDESADDAG
jgi:DNA-directed RNA polymerase subunit omega